ncbi:hypothetical protein FRC01_012304, partial [Tulasnella sp. 417]
IESVLRSFLLAMSLYPEIQAKAYAEIERVIGSDRLPTINDKGADKMPYIEAVVLEALRWNPPTGSERFLVVDEKNASVTFNKATLDPCQYVFGFGRRICPGIDMSVQEIWVAIVFILWAFEVKKKGGGEWDTDEDRFTFTFIS